MKLNTSALQLAGSYTFLSFRIKLLAIKLIKCYCVHYCQCIVLFGCCVEQPSEDSRQLRSSQTAPQSDRESEETLFASGSTDRRRPRSTTAELLSYDISQPSGVHEFHESAYLHDIPSPRQISSAFADLPHSSK